MRSVACFVLLLLCSPVFAGPIIKDVSIFRNFGTNESLGYDPVPRNTIHTRGSYIPWSIELEFPENYELLELQWREGHGEIGPDYGWNDGRLFRWGRFEMGPPRIYPPLQRSCNWSGCYFNPDDSEWVVSFHAADVGFYNQPHDLWLDARGLQDGVETTEQIYVVSFMPLPEPMSTSSVLIACTVLLRVRPRKRLPTCSREHAAERGKQGAARWEGDQYQECAAPRRAAGGFWRLSPCLPN